MRIKVVTKRVNIYCESKRIMLTVLGKKPTCILRKKNKFIKNRVFVKENNIFFVKKKNWRIQLIRASNIISIFLITYTLRKWYQVYTTVTLSLNKNTPK